MTVSDELVERVAKAIRDKFYGDGGFQEPARAAIAALSTPELVLPLAEKMLREAKTRCVYLHPSSVIVDHVRKPLPGGQQTGPGMRCADGDTLLDAYRAAKGE